MAEKSICHFKRVASIGLCFSLGCDFISPSTEKEVKAFARGVLSILISKKNPKVEPRPKNGTEDDPIQRTKANSELLHEIYQVVLIREPKDKSEFGSWVNAINQGASFEGVYNGFTHSSDYRSLEKGGGGASPEVLHVFGEELAYLEAELPFPTEFDPLTGMPLQRAFPEEQASPRPSISLAVSADNYSRLFVGASVYTLKRVLGDEALKVIEVKREFPEKLALWYSKWVVHTMDRNLDFGLPLRNKRDEKFHYKWALQTSEDRLKWEVLNRLHRILNEANRPIQ